jgi:hypothetical protein
LASRNWTLIAVLLGLTLHAQALTIGRARAVALIGKPLDVAIPIGLDESEDASQLCTEAEVFFGDDRLGSSSVNSTLARGSGREQVLRVRTTTVVNEPVVSVLVRAGCGQKSQRRFTFLADVEADAAAPGAGSRSLAPSTGSGSEPNLAAVNPPPLSEPTRVPPTSVVRREPRPSAAPARESVPAKPRSIVRKDPPPATAAASVKAERLKVDAFDPLTELIPNLKGSDQMLSQPNEAARAEAAALWRAINAQPGDVLRDTQRLQGLETDVKTLQTQAKTTAASVQDVRGQLEQARKERYFNPLVYGLGALLLLALAGLAYLASRLRKGTLGAGSSDWRQPREEAFGKTFGTDGIRAASIVHPTGQSVTINTEDIDPDNSDMVGLPEDEQEFLVDPAQTTASGFGSLGSRDGGARSVDAEELFDVQQQADFFMSLGQYDQAIEVLQNHISDNVETSALAYLDLLDIYVRLGRRDDYDMLRQDFNQVFNGQVPSFDEYRVDGRGLEAYSGALSRIEQLWGKAQVLEVIEESLFRKPDHEGQAFDLQAYRELLLLYSVAKENAGHDDNDLDLDLPLETAARAPSLTTMQPLPTERSMQTTPLSERDVAAFDKYAQDARRAEDDQAVDIDLDVLDSQLSDLSAQPQGGQSGTGSAWIEFDLDELQPAERKPRNTP